MQESSRPNQAENKRITIFIEFVFQLPSCFLSVNLLWYTSYIPILPGFEDSYRYYTPKHRPLQVSL